jgi:hypothetical protein
MRMLALTVLVSTVPFAGVVSTQDTPAPKPIYTPETAIERIRQETARNRAASPKCVLPDRTEHAVNLTVWVKGQAYRCVEVFDENLQPRGVAWTPVSLQP